jgi:hypothetical protein
MSRRRLALALAIVALAASARASAVEPPVNLGFTSFIDGFGHPRGFGFAYIQYTRFAYAGSYSDGNGGPGPFVAPRFDTFVTLHQFLYAFPRPRHFFAHPGMYILLPVVGLQWSAAPSSLQLQANPFGVGDLSFAGFLQFDPVVRSAAGIVFVQRLELAANAPTGRYDPTKQINPGTNTWYLNPYWAATLEFPPRLELSVRLQYIYDFKNDNPGEAGVNNTQAGQAVFGNFALAYEVAPRFRLGLNGYFFKQVSDSLSNGMVVPGRREQVIALGPGALWTFGKEALWFNVYAEFAVRNRFENDVFQVRWAHAF